MERIEIRGYVDSNECRLILENNIISYYNNEDIIEQQALEQAVLINYNTHKLSPKLTITLSEKNIIEFLVIANLEENLKDFYRFINAVLSNTKGIEIKGNVDSQNECRLIFGNNMIIYCNKENIIELQTVEKAILVNYNIDKLSPKLTIILPEKGIIEFLVLSNLEENLKNFYRFINAVLPNTKYLNCSTKEAIKQKKLERIAEIKQKNKVEQEKYKAEAKKQFAEAKKQFSEIKIEMKAEHEKKQAECDKIKAEAKKEFTELKTEREELIGKGDKFKEIVEKIKKNHTGFLIPYKNEAVKAARLLSNYETLIDAFVVHAATCPVGGNYKPDYFKIKNKSFQLLIITNKRLFFVESFLGKEAVKQMMLKDITSIDHKTTHFITAKLRVIGHTEMFVFDSDKIILQSIYKALNDARFAADVPPMIQQTIVQAQQPEQSPKSLNDIEALADLHSRGILTDEEFSAKKKQLLGV